MMGYFNNLDSMVAEYGIDMNAVMAMSSILTLVITLVGFIFKAIALYVMAKRAGEKHKLLAFVPFFNWLLMGKLSKDYALFGKRFKKAGLTAGLLASLLALQSFLLQTVYNLGGYIDLVAKAFDVTVTFTNPVIQDFLFTDKYSSVYNIIYWVLTIFDLAYIYFEITLVFSIFRRYCPQRAILYSLLSIFTDGLLLGIFLFIVRKNKPMSYAEYMQKRMFGGYNNYNNYNNYSNHNNPNNNNYGGYNGYSNYNGYNNASQQKPRPEPKKEEDPFPEFSNDDKSGNDYFN